MAELKTRMAVLETRVEKRQIALDRALNLAKDFSDKHFEDLNHARARDGDLTATFLRAEVYNKSEEGRYIWQRAVDAKLSRLQTIGSVLLFVIPLAVVLADHFIK